MTGGTQHFEVVGFDRTGMPYVINDEGHICPIDEITEVWTLHTSDGVSWIKC